MMAVPLVSFKKGNTIFSPGAAAGTFAIAFRSIGFVGKLLAEALEEISPGPLEALNATGTPASHVLLKGAWPQIAPAFWGVAIIRRDILIRDSAELGLVGAGGIGVVLDDSINFFQRDCVATILLASLIIIIVAEVIVRRLRSRLI